MVAEAPRSSNEGLPAPSGTVRAWFHSWSQAGSVADVLPRGGVGEELVTAFVTDVFSRRIVGWRTMSKMPTDLPLDALEMALWIRDRAGEDITGVIQHSDAGSQYTALRYTERLAEVGSIASIGTVGDSYDNALADKNARR